MNEAETRGFDGFVCTASTPDQLKSEVKEGIEFHLEGLKEDNDPIPALSHHKKRDLISLFL
jgi:predicted RNase H-like HicB family nuclease